MHIEKCPSVDECRKKLGGIYIVDYSAVKFKKKKMEILPFATACMDPEIIMLSEINQPKKDKYHVISLICGI